MSARVGLDDQQRRTQAGNSNQRNNSSTNSSRNKASRGRGGGPGGTSGRRRGDSPSAASTTSTASDIDAINAELEDANYFRDDAIEANFMSDASAWSSSSIDATHLQSDATQQHLDVNTQISHGGDPNAPNAVFYDTSVHPVQKFRLIAQNFLKRLYTNKQPATEDSDGPLKFDAEQNADKDKSSSAAQLPLSRNNNGAQQQGSSKKAASKADKRKLKNSNDAFYRDWRITFNTATQHQLDHNGVPYNAYDLFMIGNDVGQNVIRNAYVRNSYANMFLVWFTNYLQHLVAAVKAATAREQQSSAGANKNQRLLHAPELPILSANTCAELMRIFTDPTRVSVLSLLNKLLLNEADRQYAKQVFLERVREVLSCHYIFVYAFQTAHIIRAFNLYEDVMLSPAEVAVEPHRDPIEPLVKLMNSMVMVGGSAASYLVDFVDKQPTLQSHLARTLDMIVGQYERYEHDWHQLKQGDFFAHNDAEKAMLSSQKAGKQPLVKKEIVSQVYALMRRYSLPSHIAEFSEYQRKFSYITYLLYNFDKESQLPTHEDVRFEEKVDAVCANNDVLRKNFLEYLLTRRKFDIFVTLYALWIRRLPSETPPLQIPSFIHRQLREKQAAQRALQNDVDRQLWHVVQSRKPSNCVLSEYCRDYKSSGFDGYGSLVNPYAEAEPKKLRYLPLDLTFAQIKFISTRNELLAFIEQLRTMAQDFRAKTLLKQQATGEIAAGAAILVGIDCEWFDDMGVSNENLSLIQIGMGDRVFIVDMLRILDELNSSTITTEERREIWSKFSHALFLEPIFRKILYSGQHDFTVLGRIDGFVEPSDYGKQNIVDLYQIFRILKVYKPACLGLRDDEQCGSGLKDLTRLVLGAELDKTEQTSGWLRRPLRLMQVIYAALDAHVLILLYEKLKQNCAREGVPFPPNVSDAHRLANANVTIKPSSNSISSDADANSSAAVPVITPDEIKILVEAHLQGLARQLRSCGIDTLVASEGEQRRVTVRRAVEQNRTLVGTNDMRGQYKECLLDDQLYLLLPKHVQQKRCRDQCKYVLQYFNVAVREDDILTRCVGCNGVDYIAITPQQLRVHWQRHHDEQQARWQQEDERRKQDALDGWGDYGSSIQSSSLKNDVKSENAQQQLNDDDDDDDEEDEDGRALTDVSKRYRFVSKSTSSSSASTVPGVVESHVRQCFEKAVPYSEELVDADGYINNNNSSGVRVKLKFGAVPEGVLNSVDLFFACMQCGKIYWNGSHFMRVRNKFFADISQPSAGALHSAVAEHLQAPPPAVPDLQGQTAAYDGHAGDAERVHECSTILTFAADEDMTHNDANTAWDAGITTQSDVRASEQQNMQHVEPTVDDDEIDSSKKEDRTFDQKTAADSNDASATAVLRETNISKSSDDALSASKIALTHDSCRNMPVDRDFRGDSWNTEATKSLKRPERFTTSSSSSSGNGSGGYQYRSHNDRRFEQQQHYQQRPPPRYYSFHQPQQQPPFRGRSHHQQQYQFYGPPPHVRPQFDVDKDGFKIPRGYNDEYNNRSGGRISGGASSSSPPRSRSECAAESTNPMGISADTVSFKADEAASSPSPSSQMESTASGGAYAAQYSGTNNSNSSGEHDETAGLSVYMRFGRTGLSAGGGGRNSNGGSNNNGKTSVPASVTSASSSPTRTSMMDHYSPYEREGRIMPSNMPQPPSSNNVKHSISSDTVTMKTGGYHSSPPLLPPLNTAHYADDTVEPRRPPVVGTGERHIVYRNNNGNNNVQPSASFSPSTSSYGRGWITDSFFKSNHNGGGGGRGRGGSSEFLSSPSYTNYNGSSGAPQPRDYEERTGVGSGRGYTLSPAGGFVHNNSDAYPQPPQYAGRGQLQRLRDGPGVASNSSGRFNNGKRPNEFYQQQQLQSMHDVGTGNINWRS